MNNAIGLNLQTAPTIDTSQVLPVQPVSAIHSCQNGECSSQGNKFLELLNIELNALVETESPDLLVIDNSQLLENIEEIDVLDDLSHVDISNAVLVDLLQQEEKPIELLSLVEPISEELGDLAMMSLEAEFKQALTELPEEVMALPLTPENKIVIEQQALEIVKQNNPELMAQIKQVNGQALPLEGKLLPLIEEALVNQEIFKPVQIASLGVSGIAQNIFENELSDNAQLKEDSLNLVSESDLEPEIDKSFKNMFEQKESDSDVIKDKTLVENIINKASVQSDAIPQKFSTEAVSTSINNILGANQASVNIPTASAVQSGSTLLLPQNPSPEQWGSALGDKVQWMINTKLDSAELRIDPPHLGKMDISIKMTDDGAQVVIQTQHAATRELVDAASYRLKEMLEQAGHENVNVDVSHKESNQSERQMAENDDVNDQQVNGNDSKESLIASTEDILAGSFNERPGLDLFV